MLAVHCRNPALLETRNASKNNIKDKGQKTKEIMEAAGRNIEFWVRQKADAHMTCLAMFERCLRDV